MWLLFIWKKAYFFPFIRKSISKNLISYQMVRSWSFDHLIFHCFFFLPNIITDDICFQWNKIVPFFFFFFSSIISSKSDNFFGLMNCYFFRNGMFFPLVFVNLIEKNKQHLIFDWSYWSNRFDWFSMEKIWLLSNFLFHLLFK